MRIRCLSAWNRAPAPSLVWATCVYRVLIATTVVLPVLLLGACGDSDDSQASAIPDSPPASTADKDGLIQPDDSLWRMAGHDSLHTGRIAAPSIDSPVVKWKKKLGERIFAGAATDEGGTIYVSAEGERFEDVGHALFALSPHGETRWSLDIVAPIRTTPLVEDDSLLFGSYDGTFHAVTPDGQPLWKYEPEDRSQRISLSSPVKARDGATYFGDHGGALQALSSAGTPLWSFTTGDYVRAAPAIGPDGTVYVGSNDNIFYALNPDGSLKWSYETGGRIDSPATLAADGSIYFGSSDGKFYALNPDGSEKWTASLGRGLMAFASAALGQDGSVYVGTTGTSPLGSNQDQQEGSYSFLAFSPDGQLKWEYPLPHWVRSSAAVVTDGSIYFGCWDGYLYSLSPEGELRWKIRLGEISVEQGIEASPAVGPDGVIYVGTWDGWFYAIGE